MQTVEFNLKYKKNRYIIKTPLRKQEVVVILQNLLKEDISLEANSIDLKGPSKGGRTIKRIDNYVIKKTAKAEDEFKTLLRAEEITNLTPAAGGVLVEEGRKAGWVCMEFFDGIPIININPSTIEKTDKEKIIRAVLFTMGQLHIGNRRELILHRDAHLGNLIIIPNPTEREIITKTEKRLEIRVVDLEKAVITTFKKRILETMAFDLLIPLNQMIYRGLLSMDEINSYLDCYLTINYRLDEKDLKSAMKKAILEHKKLDKIEELLRFL